MHVLVRNIEGERFFQKQNISSHKKTAYAFYKAGKYILVMAEFVKLFYIITQQS